MLRVKDLTKTYENGVEALRGVSFDTPNYGMIAVVGSSGCGKSTLLNVLSGIDEKSDGEIFIFGEKCNPREIKSTFATIYQDYKLIENLSVIDNILVAKELVASDYSIEQIDALLEKLGIFECKNEKVLSLSGGQKQRVAIARALVQKPKIIFADEPTGNLDSKNSKNIFGLLQELAKDILIIVVTHDVETIKNYANRMLRLQDGVIVEDRELTELAVCKNVEKPQNIGVQKAKKVGLSFKTSMSVAIAFNKAKVGRRIAFMVISTLLLLVMMVCCNWAMIDYQTMVSATYDKRNASNMAKSQYEKYQTIEKSDGTIQVRTYCDLTPIQEYLKTKKGITSAKIYNKSIAPSIFDIPFSYEFNSLHTEGAKGKLTMQEIAYGSAGTSSYIVINDIESLGIKLLEGRSPKYLGEVAIPKSKQIYFNALGGYYDSNIEEYIEIAPDELLGYDFFGVKIVGVFDDGVEVPKKFAKPFTSWEDKEYIEAQSFVSNKVLSQVVIVPTCYSEIWDAAFYMKGTQNAKSSQGQYINTSMIVKDEIYNNIGVAPANKLTEYYTGISRVEQGSVLLSKMFATQHNMKDGDTILLSTALVRGDINTMSTNFVIDKNIQSLKKFNVKVDNRISSGWEILYNEEDYKMMMDNVKPQANQIIYNIDGLSTGELKELNKQCQKIFGVSNWDFLHSMLSFEIDDSRDLLGKYFEMRMIGDYVMIIASVILACIVVILLYNSISIIINSKANDLLILKTLGAKKLDYLKIYGIFTIVQLLVELVVGIGLGIGGVFLLNAFITKVASMEFIVQLPLIPMAILTTIAVAIVASVMSLTINICRISDKNLRKAFQKTKE